MMNIKPKQLTGKLTIKTNQQWLDNLQDLAQALAISQSELVRELVQDAYLQQLQERPVAAL